MLYNILKLICTPFFYLFFRIEVVGNNTVDENKAYIIAANHKSNLDPLLVAITFKKRKIHFIAKKELFENKILKWVLNHTHAISIDRSKSDIKALRKCYRVLKNNHVLGIFPQGTRVKDAEEDTSKAGIGMFAIRTNTPIIPVSIIAEKEYKIFSKIVIIYHKPYYVAQRIVEEKNSEDYLKVSNEVMDIIKGKI